MSYHDAVERLFSLERSGIKLGLDNIRVFCDRLGRPQDRFPAIHIAGTNGKGSVSAILESIFRCAGFRTGRFTSPHLRDFRERIHLNGRPISRDRVVAFTKRHWPVIRRGRYSYFEVVTAMAFDAFASTRAGIGIVEVGLGGRFDATNILSPLLSVITHLDFDHERILGRTIRRIAFEKSGIIKEGVPVLVGSLPPDGLQVLRRIAAERGAPFFTAHDVLRAAGRYWGAALRDCPWSFPLPGRHQAGNLGVAVAAVCLCQQLVGDLPWSSVRRGVQDTRWPARFQIVTGTPNVVYDVAHNPSGMRRCAETWKRMFGRRRAVALFTTRQDKNYRAMWKLLAPCVSHWVGCPLPHGTGIGKSEMERLARRARVGWSWADSARDGLRRARELAGFDGHVLVVGSHYLVGDVITPAQVSSPAESPVMMQRIPWRQLVSAVDLGRT